MSSTSFLSVYSFVPRGPCHGTATHAVACGVGLACPCCTGVGWDVPGCSPCMECFFLCMGLVPTLSPLSIWELCCSTFSAFSELVGDVVSDSTVFFKDRRGCPGGSTSAVPPLSLLIFLCCSQPGLQPGLCVLTLLYFLVLLLAFRLSPPLRFGRHHPSCTFLVFFQEVSAYACQFSLNCPHNEWTIPCSLTPTGEAIPCSPPQRVKRYLNRLPQRVKR